MFLSMKTAIEGNVVLYIDTKNDFCVDRLVEMIEGNLPKNTLSTDKKRDVILDKIRVCKIFDLTTLNNVLANLCNDQSFSVFNVFVHENCHRRQCCALHWHQERLLRRQTRRNDWGQLTKEYFVNGQKARCHSWQNLSSQNLRFDNA